MATAAPRPNPLTDELSDEAKQELAAIFAAMKQRYGYGCRCESCCRRAR